MNIIPTLEFAPNARMRTSGLPVSVIFILVVAVVSGMVFLQVRWNQSIDWQNPNITVTKYRGADGAEKPPVYSTEELATLTALLQNSITRNYEQQVPRKFTLAFGSKANFSMGTQVQELFDGGLSVHVEAQFTKGATRVNEWQAEYASADAFRSECDGLGSKIGSELAAARRK